MQSYRMISRLVCSPWFWVVYYGLVMVKEFSVGWWMLFWLLGGLLGWLYQFADQLVSVYVLRPHNQLSLEVQQLVASKRWPAVVRLLRSRRDEQEELMGLSVVFLAAWAVLAVFLITSSESWLARGLVMGIGLRAVSEAVCHWERLPILKQKLFWQIKRVVSDEEARGVVAVLIGVFVALSLLL